MKAIVIAHTSGFNPARILSTYVVGEDIHLGQAIYKDGGTIETEMQRIRDGLPTNVWLELVLS
jgi:hypothetical protein